MFSDFTWNRYLIKDILFIIAIILTVILAYFIEKRKMNKRSIFSQILPALNLHTIKGARIGILINFMLVIGVLFLTHGEFITGRIYYYFAIIFILIPVLFAIGGYLYGKNQEIKKGNRK